MTTHFAYLEGHALLFERITGSFSLQETLTLYDQFGRDPKIVGTRLKLADLRAIKDISMTETEMGNLLDLIAKQYLHRLQSFRAGVLQAGEGPGLDVAHAFFVRLPETIKPRFRQLSSVDEALAYLTLPPEIRPRQQAQHLTAV